MAPKKTAGTKADASDWAAKRQAKIEAAKKKKEEREDALTEHHTFGPTTRTASKSNEPKKRPGPVLGARPPLIARASLRGRAAATSHELVTAAAALATSPKESPTDTHASFDSPDKTASPGVGWFGTGPAAGSNTTPENSVGQSSSPDRNSAGGSSWLRGRLAMGSSRYDNQKQAEVVGVEVGTSEEQHQHAYSGSIGGLLQSSVSVGTSLTSDDGSDSRHDSTARLAGSASQGATHEGPAAATSGFGSVSSRSPPDSPDCCVVATLDSIQAQRVPAQSPESRGAVPGGGVELSGHSESIPRNQWSSSFGYGNADAKSQGAADAPEMRNPGVVHGSSSSCSSPASGSFSWWNLADSQRMTQDDAQQSDRQSGTTYPPWERHRPPMGSDGKATFSAPEAGARPTSPRIGAAGISDGPLPTRPTLRTDSVDQQEASAGDLTNGNGRNALQSVLFDIENLSNRIAAMHDLEAERHRAHRERTDLLERRCTQLEERLNLARKTESVLRQELLELRPQDFAAQVQQAPQQQPSTTPVAGAPSQSRSVTDSQSFADAQTDWLRGLPESDHSLSFDVQTQLRAPRDVRCPPWRLPPVEEDPGEEGEQPNGNTSEIPAFEGNISPSDVSAPEMVKLQAMCERLQHESSHFPRAELEHLSDLIGRFSELMDKNPSKRNVASEILGAMPASSARPHGNGAQSDTRKWVPGQGNVFRGGSTEPEAADAPSPCFAPKLR